MTMNSDSTNHLTTTSFHPAQIACLVFRFDSFKSSVCSQFLIPSVYKLYFSTVMQFVPHEGEMRLKSHHLCRQNS